MDDIFQDESLDECYGNFSIDEQVFSAMTNPSSDPTHNKTHGDTEPLLFTGQEQPTPDVFASFEDFDSGSYTGLAGATGRQSGLTGKELKKDSSPLGMTQEDLTAQPFPTFKEDPVPNNSDSLDNFEGDSYSGPTGAPGVESKLTGEKYEMEISPPETVQENIAARASQKLREKNRIAAKRCRDNKRHREQERQESVRYLQTENNRLWQVLQQKRAEVARLRIEYDMHRNSGCPGCLNHY